MQLLHVRAKPWSQVKKCQNLNHRWKISQNHKLHSNWIWALHKRWINVSLFHVRWTDFTHDLQWWNHSQIRKLDLASRTRSQAHMTVLFHVISKVAEPHCSFVSFAGLNHDGIRFTKSLMWKGKNDLAEIQDWCFPWQRSELDGRKMHTCDLCHMWHVNGMELGSDYMY